MKPIMVVALSLLLCSCGSKLSKQNFDQITTAMTYEEVVALLGDPTDEMHSSASMPAQNHGAAGKTPATSIALHTWKEGRRFIAVEFKDGKVSSKSALGL